MRVESRELNAGSFVAEVRRNESDEVLFVSDPSPTQEGALGSGRAWACWMENLPLGRAESIYYILAVPETWAGPPEGAHPYSGLHFKIGRATDVRKRVQNLSTGTSAKLIVHALEPGSAALETERHRQFQADRRQGEWFACSPPLIRHVFATWQRYRAMPPHDQYQIMALMDRIAVLRKVRKTLGGPPDMINPSLNEDWYGKVFVDLVFANPLKDSED